MSEKEKKQVWDKAKVIDGKDPTKYRLDPYGKEIYYGCYGKNSPMGWQIDHIKPSALGGSDDIRNKQALNSHTNMSKGASLVKASRHSESNK